MDIDYHEFTLAAHYLPAIVNNDYSGLDEADAADLDAFMHDYWKYPENGSFALSFCIVEDTNRLAVDEVTGLLADCYTCRLYFTNKELDHATN